MFYSFLFRMTSIPSGHSNSIVQHVHFEERDRVCAEKHDQRWMLNQHYMFMEHSMFFHLIQCGLVDKILKVFDDADQKQKEMALQVTGQKRPREGDDVSDDNTNLALKKTKRSDISTADTATQTDY